MRARRAAARNVELERELAERAAQIERLGVELAEQAASRRLNEDRLTASEQRYRERIKEGGNFSASIVAADERGAKSEKEE